MLSPTQFEVMETIFYNTRLFQWTINYQLNELHSWLHFKAFYICCCPICAAADLSILVDLFENKTLQW